MKTNYTKSVVVHRNEYKKGSIKYESIERKKN